MSHENASVKSIIFALTANLGIAITKTIAAILTGSGAMLAESIHSFADCGNQGLLFLGLKAAKKEADEEHPLGHGKATYFWSFIVAIMLFSMGGLFSIYEGVHKLGATEEINNPLIAIIVLAASFIMEAFSLWGCISQINKIKGNVKLWYWLRNSRQSELVVVFGEDVAALLGLFLALIAVVVSALTNNPAFDAIGSICIGVVLVLVSFFVAIRIKSLLIGQSTDVEKRQQIKLFIENQPEVQTVFNLITLQLGPEIMVAIKAKMTDKQTSNELIEDINKCENNLRIAFPDIKWIFFEPDNAN